MAAVDSPVDLVVERPNDWRSPHPLTTSPNPLLEHQAKKREALPESPEHKPNGKMNNFKADERVVLSFVLNDQLPEIQPGWVGKVVGPHLNTMFVRVEFDKKPNKVFTLHSSQITRITELSFLVDPLEKRIAALELWKNQLETANSLTIKEKP